MTENIIDSTEKQAASADARRQREEEARQQRERYGPDLFPAVASTFKHVQCYPEGTSCQLVTDA